MVLASSLAPWLLLGLSGLIIVVNSSDSHDRTRDHGDRTHDAPWGWAGIFPVESPGLYTWCACKVDGVYADEAMRLLVMPTANATAEGLEAVEPEAEALWEAQQPTDVHATHTTNLTCSALYTLVFNPAAFLSLYHIALPPDWEDGGGGARAPLTHIAIFLQHSLAEVACAMPALHSVGGAAVLPAHSSDAPAAVVPGPATLSAVGASLSVACASCFGLVLLTPGVNWLAERFDILIGIDAFASGALLATVVFLFLPEAYLSIQKDGPEDGHAPAWFGLGVLFLHFPSSTPPVPLNIAVPPHQATPHLMTPDVATPRHTTPIR